MREGSSRRDQGASVAHTAVEDLVSMLQSVEILGQDDHEIKCKAASSFLPLSQQAPSLNNQEDNEEITCPPPKKRNEKGMQMIIAKLQCRKTVSLQNAT